ncbi:hypothetical protein [Botrimarina mediterranea]|uniref:Uncharacterized protein n=1 Tax=Botrimarina mediterranea TaxID=2528022 RepID=A0A518K542_9BACT|nr:hypothetical protein [Botrimarina mediterranea]QDV72895.1 hypothetical protein Spa11_10790 [Botrimarina mediterranea]
MTGRILSIVALVGCLATLVLVATLAGGGEMAPRQDAAVSISEPVVAPRSRPVPIPKSRVIYRIVRQQSDANRVTLASCER